MLSFLPGATFFVAFAGADSFFFGHAGHVFSGAFGVVACHAPPKSNGVALRFVSAEVHSLDALVL